MFHFTPMVSDGDFYHRFVNDTGGLPSDDFRSFKRAVNVYVFAMSLQPRFVARLSWLMRDGYKEILAIEIKFPWRERVDPAVPQKPERLPESRMDCSVAICIFKFVNDHVSPE